MSLGVDVLGWIGAVMLLYAYGRVSSGTWTGQTRAYQVLNVVGSALFIINTAYHRAFPPLFVNIVWAAIALRALVRFARPV